MRNNIFRSWMLASLICFWFPCDLRGTTMKFIELSCPVCNKRIAATVIPSTNTFGGMDRDFMSRAAGAQPLLIFPITCTGCFYSGYRKDFENEIKISEKVIIEIREKKILKPILAIQENVDYGEIPAWIRYDLIAQTYQLLQKKEDDIGQQYIMAGWVIRLTRNILSKMDKETAEKINKMIDSKWDKDAVVNENRADYETGLGRELALIGKRNEGEPRKLAAYAAISLLMAHGENGSVYEILSMLKTVETEKKFLSFERAVKESIVLEQLFQAKAIPFMETAVQKEGDNIQKGILMYECGELHRRVGNWDKARYFFELSERTPGLPEWLARWVKEQKGLLPKLTP